MKYYEILDVPVDANQEQIKNAYRILVQLHHPDRLQQVSPHVRQYAEDRLKKINEAYQVLGDPERRARYDATLARTQPAHAPAGWGDFAGYDFDEDEEEDEAWAYSRRRYRRRPRTAEEAAAEAAYEAWAHQEAERYAQEREAERARQAERENQEAEARARRAAEEQYPRARVEDGGESVIVNFAPGVWTTLRRVPAGAFTMGADPAADPQAGRSEQPAHRVHVSEYFISQYPVTNAQFQAFARAANHALPVRLPSGQDTHPVTHVTWDDAVAFCQWLSRFTARDFRLPTEAEWEKAARGSEANLYPWGQAWDPARVNCLPDSDHAVAPAGTTPVGHFSPAGDSPYGLADMSGNVWEWCSDWFDGKLYARRAGQAVHDPQGPDEGPGYVARGGAFDSPPKHARCAYRTWFAADHRRGNLGFRFVMGL